MMFRKSTMLLTRPKRHWAGAKSIAHRRRNPLSCWHQPKTHAAKTTWRPKRRSSDATTDARRTSAKTSASPMRLTWIDMDWHGLTWIDSGDSCPLQQMLQPILIDCCMWASLKEMVAQSVPSSVRSNNSCLSIWIRVMPSTLLKFICFLEASPWENKLTKLMFALDYFGKEIPMHAARHWNTMHISRRNE